MGVQAFAMYNLGVALLYGFGDERQPDLAANWFAASGLPEGMAAVAMHRDAKGLKEEAEAWRQRATRLGFGTFWREKARMFTGAGGVPNVDLHSNWEKHAPPGYPVPPRW